MEFNTIEKLLRVRPYLTNSGPFLAARNQPVNLDTNSLLRVFRHSGTKNAALAQVRPRYTDKVRSKLGVGPTLTIDQLSRVRSIIHKYNIIVKHVNVLYRNRAFGRELEREIAQTKERMQHLQRQ